VSSGWPEERDSVPIVAPIRSPGHLLRRAHQVHTDLWATRVEDLTGPQYATLAAVAGWDDVDQRRAGQLASLDKSTVAEVVRRLTVKGWLERVRDPADGRRWLLNLPPGCRERLMAVTKGAESVQEALVSPLAAADRERFVDLLGRVARIDEADAGHPEHPNGLLMMRDTPGYLIRRAQQVHTALWSVTVRDVTGPQYAVLAAVAGLGVTDQTRIGERASLDASTTASVVDRLRDQGWLAKEAADDDRRRAKVRLSVPAAAALRELVGPVSAVQRELLVPLPSRERPVFVRLLSRVARAGRGQTP
jgi:DNA-binding MarR family transcriptional regulator